MGPWGAVCLIDINASAVNALAADRLELHQTTGDVQWSAALMGCPAAGDQQCALRCDDVVIWIGNRFTTSFYKLGTSSAAEMVLASQVQRSVS